MRDHVQYILEENVSTSLTIFVLLLFIKVLEPSPQKCTCVHVASAHRVRLQRDTSQQNNPWMECKSLFSLSIITCHCFL